VYTEDFGSDNRGDGKTVEHVDKCLPDFDITPPFAFIIEAIDCKTRGVNIATVAPNNQEEFLPRVTLAHSWFPRNRKKFSGNLTL